MADQDYQETDYDQIGFETAPGRWMEDLLGVFSLRGFADRYNECVPWKDLYAPSTLNDPSVQIGFGTVYALIWLLGVGGNSLVLIVMAYGATRQCESRKRNAAFPVRSVFVASLASADLLVALTSLPVTAVTAFTGEWVFPSFLCYCISFFQAFSIFQSSFTLTNLAIDRYLLIVYPRRAFVTYTRARFAVVSTAVIAAAIASPMAIFMDVIELPPLCGKICMETWPQATQAEETEVLFHYNDDHNPQSSAGLSRRTYGLFVAVLQFFLPTIVTAVCYVLISKNLEQQQRARRAAHLLMPDAERRLRHRRHRTNRMMAMMVAAFALLWLPLNAINLTRDFGIYGQLFGQRSFHITYASCHLLAMASLVWNPFVYAWYNQMTKSVVLSLCGRCTRAVTETSHGLRQRVRL